LTSPLDESIRGIEMHLRRPLAVLLVSMLATLFPLAYSQLPDQLWLGGYFDGGDEDDTLLTIQLNLNAVQVSPVAVFSSLQIVSLASRLCERLTPTRAHSFASTRAPPIS